MRSVIRIASAASHGPTAAHASRPNHRSLVTSGRATERETAIVIVARSPERGRVKTRLAKVLGVDETLAVYRSLMMNTARALSAWDGPVLLASTGDPAAWQGSPLAHLPRRAQPKGGLGSRIWEALAWGLEIAPSAVVIGTDCPGLSAFHLRTVAALLQQLPVAFGPATDGGYWCVATRDAETLPILGDDALPWSSPDTLSASRAALAAAGIFAALGPCLADCDDVADLAHAVAEGLVVSPASPDYS